MNYQHIRIPDQGEIVTMDEQGDCKPSRHPIILFIEGDGIGVDITPVMQKVVNAAVQKVYGTERMIHWVEVYAGKKATRLYGDSVWLPQETLTALNTYHIGIKGPLMTPVGGGIRSLNVALRQELDLFICYRPIRYYEGIPSPLRHPEKTHMSIFRENSEDIYVGIEWASSTPEAQQLIEFLQNTLGVRKIRFPDSSGIGIKPVSKEGTERFIRGVMHHAIEYDSRSITLVHKGNIMKHTEGAFRDWAYQLIQEQFGGKLIDQGPWMTVKNPNTGREMVVKDVIADAFLQQILLHPEEYDVIATLNLNGDYISDALAAQVGGIGIAPGANLGRSVALFEATHGTAPKYAGQDKVNPSAMILSAEMMLRHLGWTEAAQCMIRGIEKTIQQKKVTYDLAKSMEGAIQLSCSEFGQALIQNL